MTKRTTPIDKTDKTTKRTSQGRRKIEIKRIENTNSRQVTFSKRRTGLNNKASELCVLTGAQVVILVESPGNRVFAYGNPNVDSIIGKYLGDESSSNSPENNNPVSGVDVNMNMNQEFNKKFMEISEELEIEKSKSRVVSENNIGGDLCWWEESYENLGLEELEKYIDSMDELMNNVATRADEMLLTSSMFEPNSDNVDGLVQQGLDNSDQLISSTNQVVPNYVYGDDFLMPNYYYGDDLENFGDGFGLEAAQI